MISHFREINTVSELDDFRSRWTGDVTLSLLHRGRGSLLMNCNVGVGKSYNMDATTVEALKSGIYDLVLVFPPTRRLIDEREPLKSPPDGYRVVNILPRPQLSCGIRRNEKWRVLEANNMGTMGKNTICRDCPKVLECPWPSQYGKSMKGASLVYATQAHLNRSSTFIYQVVNWTGAERPLVIFDEASFFMRSFKVLLKVVDLRRFIDVVGQVRFADKPRLTRLNGEWAAYLGMLSNALSEDLCSPDWGHPFLDPYWVLTVQKKGYELYGESFRFIGYDIQQFKCSIMVSREKLPGIGIQFSVRPWLPYDTIVYSASVSSELTEYRLNRRFYSPFKDIRFLNEGTTWYNIDSRIGMKSYFGKNMPEILGFFAMLITLRIGQGKRILLLSKKDLVDKCASELQKRLDYHGCPARIVTDFAAGGFDHDTSIVPLIHYGVIGVNDFKDFDCAYCLNGYYVNEPILNTILQDILPVDMVVPLKIQTTRTLPRRRVAGVADTEDRFDDVHHMAQTALEFLEMETVIQAVGRVRPFTSPREVITFQCHENPHTPYTQEFHNLEQARDFFGIPTVREHAVTTSISQITALKMAGMSQKQTAEELSVGLRTVERYWNK